MRWWNVMISPVIESETYQQCELWAEVNLLVDVLFRAALKNTWRVPLTQLNRIYFKALMINKIESVCFSSFLHQLIWRFLKSSSYDFSTNATPSPSSWSRREAWPPPAPSACWTFSQTPSTRGCPLWSAPPTTSTSTCRSWRSTREAAAASWGFSLFLSRQMIPR